MDVLKTIHKKISNQKMKSKERDKSILEYVQCMYSPTDYTSELTTGTTVFLKASESSYFLVFFTVYISCFIILLNDSEFWARLNVWIRGVVSNSQY